MIRQLYKFLEQKCKTDNLSFFTQSKFIQISACCYNLDCSYYIFGRYENDFFKKTEEPKDDLKFIQNMVVKYLFKPYIASNIFIQDINFETFKKNILSFNLDKKLKRLIIQAGKFCFIVDPLTNKDRLPTGGPINLFIKN